MCRGIVFKHIKIGWPHALAINISLKSEPCFIYMADLIYCHLIYMKWYVKMSFVKFKRYFPIVFI